MMKPVHRQIFTPMNNRFTTMDGTPRPLTISAMLFRQSVMLSRQRYDPSAAPCPGPSRPRPVAGSAAPSWALRYRTTRHPSASTGGMGDVDTLGDGRTIYRASWGIWAGRCRDCLGPCLEAETVPTPGGRGGGALLWHGADRARATPPASISNFWFWNFG